MTIASESRLGWARLADVDPELWGAMVQERDRQREKIELIASENYTFAAVMEAQGSWLTNKYAEGLPGKRYYGGCEYVDIAETARPAAGAGALPGRGARQRPAPLGRPGEHGRLLQRPPAGRPHPRHEPRPRRPPDARLAGQLLRPAVRGPRLRRRQGDRADRLRRPRGDRPGGAAEAGRRGRLRVSTDHRLPAHGRHRPRRRRAAVRRHGPHRRARRRGRPPEPVPARRHRHDDDPQDAPRRPRRPDLQPRRAAPGDRSGGLPDGQDDARRPDRQGGLPGRPGRAADARHRRQGGGPAARRRRAVPARPAADRRERGRARRGARLARGADRVGRHGQPPDARRRDAARA